MTDDTTTTTTDLGGGWHRDGKYMTWTARDCGAIRLSDYRVRDDGTSVLLIQARTVDLGHPDDPEPGWWAATVEVLPRRCPCCCGSSTRPPPPGATSWATWPGRKPARGRHSD